MSTIDYRATLAALQARRSTLLSELSACNSAIRALEPIVGVTPSPSLPRSKGRTGRTRAMQEGSIRSRAMAIIGKEPGIRASELAKRLGSTSYLDRTYKTTQQLVSTFIRAGRITRDHRRGLHVRATGVGHAN